MTSAADYGQWWVKVEPEIVADVAKDMAFSPTSRQDFKSVYISEDDFPEFKERARASGIVIKVDPNIEFHDGWSPIREYGMVNTNIDRALNVGDTLVMPDGREVTIEKFVEVVKEDA
ncbi:MAG: hypothetical protein AAF213_08770 [Pseudomonadota bacterium]